MSASRLPLLLIVAGVAAAIFSQLGSVPELFPATADVSGPLGLGPEWTARVPDVAGGLGLGAALCGAIQWRWPDQAVAAVVAVLLWLGTAFVIWWLVTPPAGLFDAAVAEFHYAWWLWASAAALLVAALAATVLATRPGAAARA